MTGKTVRVRTLVLAAFAAALVAGCGGSSGVRGPALGVRVWLTRAHEPRPVRCVSSRCGGYAVTLHWSSIAVPGKAGYELYSNGTQVGLAASRLFTFRGLACGTKFTLGVVARNSSGATSHVYTARYTTPACARRMMDCFSAPGACGYPDPRYGGGNVGVANCSSLTTVTSSNLAAVLPTGSYYYSGSGYLLEVVGSNVTWRNLNFAGWQIYVGSGNNNLTLNDDCVATDGAGGIIGLNDQASGLTITNSTVEGLNNTNEAFSANTIQCRGTCTLTNDLITNTTDGVGVFGGDTLNVTNSYIYANAVESGSHNEPIYANTATVNVSHSVLLNSTNQTADVFMESSSPCSTHLSITRSLLAGGGYMIYSCGNSSGAGTSTMTVTKTDFARCLGAPSKEDTVGNYDGVWYCGTQAAPDTTQGSAVGAGADSHGFWPRGGSYRVDAATYCSGAGITWSGNYWDDDGAAVSCQ